MTLNRTLSYKKHLQNLAEKTNKRCNLVKRLASNRWGADFITLRTSVLALCYSVAEYCSPVWSQSHHCKMLDTSLNKCMRLVSGSIKSTPTTLLPVLCGIEPPDIRRDRNILKLRERAMKDSHLIHQPATSPLVNVCLKSRMPLSTQMHILSNQIEGNMSPELWMKSAWNRRWNDSECLLREFIVILSEIPAGYDLNRSLWVLLNRIWSGSGRHASYMHKIGLSDNLNCICGDVQTPQHVLNCRTIGIRGNIWTVDDDLRNWLNHNKLLDI